jgi:hypothetical protein
MDLLRRENYDRLWKIITIFHKLSDAYAKNI